MNSVEAGTKGFAAPRFCCSSNRRYELRKGGAYQASTPEMQAMGVPESSSMGWFEEADLRRLQTGSST
jgi:hypothetical protein